VDGKKKILVVDDDASVVQILTDKLVNEGFIVFRATNGAECLKLAEEKKPDLIVLDLMMPVMGGLEVLEKLRSSGEWGKKMPVVIITNIDPDENIVRRIAKTKPFYFYAKGIFDLDELVKKIKVGVIAES